MTTAETEPETERVVVSVSELVVEESEIIGEEEKGEALDVDDWA